MIGRIGIVAAGLFLLGQWLNGGAAQAEPRIALVIGNSHYGADIGSLPNPVNDAGLMAQALQQTGFTVIKVIDADQKKLKRAIIDFGDKLTAAGPTATGLFFYAGHGVQVKGMNYLVPIGADISKESDVGIEAVSADDVLQQMEYAGARVNIVVLDACRNNPLQRGFRSVTRGLAPMDAAQGTFIAYSTAPGSVAADGSGQNSPYTQALAKTITTPGLGIEEAFRDVRANVMKVTDNKQVPWDSSSLTAPFYFKPAAASQTFTTASQPSQKPATAAYSAENDKAVWDGIKDSKAASDYRAYLDQYPNGIFANIAKSRLAQYGGDGVAREQTVPAPAVQPASAPAAEPVTTTTTTTDSGSSSEDASSESTSAAAAAAKKCAIRDDTLSDSDLCRRNRKEGYNGGSRSTGSNKWK
ncbi:MAG TPA: caspase domain-containing protein [Dongiaceae bacterium]|nr:caspase domain-containing protein [Dongiaceae bacterium]